MKRLILIFILIFTGCSSDKKLKKIKINPEDTKITKDKINNSIKDIDKVIEKPFQIQQNIDKELKNISNRNYEKRK